MNQTLGGKLDLCRGVLGLCDKHSVCRLAHVSWVIAFDAVSESRSCFSPESKLPAAKPPCTSLGRCLGTTSPASGHLRYSESRWCVSAENGLQRASRFSWNPEKFCHSRAIRPTSSTPGSGGAGRRMCSS